MQDRLTYLRNAGYIAPEYAKGEFVRETGGEFDVSFCEHALATKGWQFTPALDMSSDFSKYQVVVKFTGGRAKSAGVLPGDRITKINGHSVTKELADEIFWDVESKGDAVCEPRIWRAGRKCFTGLEKGDRVLSPDDCDKYWPGTIVHKNAYDERGTYRVRLDKKKEMADDEFMGFDFEDTTILHKHALGSNLRPFYGGKITLTFAREVRYRDAKAVVRARNLNVGDVEYIEWRMKGKATHALKSVVPSKADEGTLLFGGHAYLAVFYKGHVMGDKIHIQFSDVSGVAGEGTVEYKADAEDRLKKCAIWRTLYHDEFLSKHNVLTECSPGRNWRLEDFKTIINKPYRILSLHNNITDGRPEEAPSAAETSPTRSTKMMRACWDVRTCISLIMTVKTTRTLGTPF